MAEEYKCFGTRNIGAFVVPPDFVKHALRLPESVSVVGAEWDWAQRSIRLFVEGDLMPSCPPGGIPMELNAIAKVIHVKTERDGEFVTETEYEWEFGPATPMTKVEYRKESE